jgi:hypothetical protein
MRVSLLSGIVVNALLASAACPFMDAGGSSSDDDGGYTQLRKREEKFSGDDGFLDRFAVDDSDSYTTTDFGTPVDDRHSLKVGARGGVLLEDFVLRSKITRFDHERIPERAGEFVLGRRARMVVLTNGGTSSCPWCRRPWLLRVVRRLVEHHRCVFPGHGRKADAHFPEVLHRCRIPGKCRHREGCPRILPAFLHRRGQLRYDASAGRLMLRVVC